MKFLPLLLLPLTLLASPELGFDNQSFAKTYDSKDNRIMLNVGPASTIYNKTRVRPRIGLSLRSNRLQNIVFDDVDVQVSYSYAHIERPKREYSIGEIYYPRIALLKNVGDLWGVSFYLGGGGGIFRSWQIENHANSPSFLSSNDDHLYNINSFKYYGISANFLMGSEFGSFQGISSGLQVELGTPVIPLSRRNSGKPSPLSVAISYMAGF